MSEIQSTDARPRERVTVLNSEMAYVDTGVPAGGEDAPTVVFLHGNPTSSFLWRNVMTPVESVARCVAPDLIGMGESGKNPDGSYTFEDHARYLDAWFDAVLPAGPLVLVIHDWGSALGFHWTRRHPDRVVGLVYMEAIVGPIASWDEWPENARRIFQGLRSEAGEEMILEKNVFVERILPSSVLRDLSEEEMVVYRLPFLEAGEVRRPTLTWPRQIPIAGEPPEVVAVAEAYAEWMRSSDDLPKVFVNAEPGSILVGAARDACRAWPNQTEVTVPGLHFIQEDSPQEIGEAVVGLLERI